MKWTPYIVSKLQAPYISTYKLSLKNIMYLTELFPCVHVAITACNSLRFYFCFPCIYHDLYWSLILIGMNKFCYSFVIFCLKRLFSCFQISNNLLFLLPLLALLQERPLKFNINLQKYLYYDNVLTMGKRGLASSI